MKQERKVDGIEIPHRRESIASIQPDLFGYATLFRRTGRTWAIVARLEGNIRDLLASDIQARRPEEFPEIVMYSGALLGRN